MKKAKLSKYDDRSTAVGNNTSPLNGLGLIMKQRTTIIELAQLEEKNGGMN